MINVVEVISDRNIGGAGILLVNRLKNSDRKKFKTIVILPRGSELTDRFRKIGICAIEINAFADRSLDISGIPILFALLKKIKPDIINAHSCLGARVAARFANVPVVLHTRHCIYPIKKIYAIPLVKNVNRALDKILGDKTIAVAEVVKKQLVATGMEPSRIHVIINGAEPLRRFSEHTKEKTRKALGISRDDTVVTICARLEICKDHETFLRAAKYILLKNKKCRFLIIGGGSQEAYLKEKASKYGIKNRVIFTGAVADVAPYMNITDINVNCSIGTETSSLALSEGMSLGIPAIASDYGGNPYMVKHGANGYLFHQRDAKDLADKILLLENKSEYKKLSLGARERFETELNARRMTRETEKFYCSLIVDRKN